MTNLEITAPDAEYLDIREIFAHRGENAGQLPKVWPPEEKPEPKKVNPVKVCVGIGCVALAGMISGLCPMIPGVGVLVACGCKALDYYIPVKMS